MNKPITRASYHERIDRVLEYIHNHLDDELDMNRLAEIACFSPYHWHRIYRELVGETAAQTVRRLRMHRAAGELIKEDRDVAKIARDAGFSSVEAFNRAFRSSFDLPPGRFRTHYKLHAVQNNFKQGKPIMSNVEIRDLPAMRLATVHHKGPYMEISRAFEKLGLWIQSNITPTESTKVLAIYYDDPMAVAPEKLRSDAAIEVDHTIKADDTVNITELKSGRHAVYLHKGPYADLQTSYSWLYQTWLPNSGEETADAPPFEVYLNNPKSTPPADLLTEICIPLAG